MQRKGKIKVEDFLIVIDSYREDNYDAVDTKDNSDKENNINEENLDNIIILNDEEGNEIQFEFLDLIEYNSEEYVVLLPVDEDEDEEEPGEVVILKVEQDSLDGDEESYIGIEDQEELNAVFQIFKDKFKDEFNFLDEEE